MLEKPPTISIVIPALNEAANLRVVLPRLPQVHEVVLVDGHSVDGTVEVARELCPGITVVQQTRRGKGNALACGFAAATGDIIVMLDADGSADPAEIPDFVGALVGGADFAKGSRFSGTRSPDGEHWSEGHCGSADISHLRRLGNAGLNTLANALFRTRYSDLCYGYNAFWRDILPLLRLPAPEARGPDPDRMLWGDGFEIEAVLSCRAAAARLQVAEVPSFERRRLFGETNLRTFVDGSRVLRTILVERFAAGGRRPRRLPSTVPADLGIPAAAATATGLDAIRARRPPAPAGLHAVRSRPRHSTGGPGSNLSEIWHWADQRTEGHTR